MKVLNDYKLKETIKILWADMDAYGHVNSAKYFTYFEAARIKYYENLNLLVYFKNNDLFAVVSQADCTYMTPLTFPDKITIGSRVVDIFDDYFTMEYYITGSKGLSAFGEAEITLFDPINKKKIKIPQEVKNRINEFENGTD